MEKKSKFKRVDIRYFLNVNKDKLRKYKNVERLVVEGKCKVTTNLGNERMYVSLKNQNGRSVVMAPSSLDYYYTKSENGVYKPQRGIMKCRAMPVEQEFMFAGSSGEYYYVQPGDFVMIYKNRFNEDQFMAMDMVEFVDKFALNEPKRRRTRKSSVKPVKKAEDTTVEKISE